MRKAAIAAGKIFLFLLISLGMIVLYVAVVAPAVGRAPGAKASDFTNIVFEVVQVGAMLLAAAAMYALIDRKSPMGTWFPPRSMVGDILTGAIVGAFIFFAALGLAFTGGSARLDLDLSSFSMAALGVSA